MISTGTNKTRRIVAYVTEYNEDYRNRDDLTVVGYVKNEEGKLSYLILESIDTSEVDQLREKVTEYATDAKEFEEALAESIDEVDALNNTNEGLNKRIETLTKERCELRAENNRLRDDITKRFG